jgi:hypothetical protein
MTATTRIGTPMHGPKPRAPEVVANALDVWTVSIILRSDHGDIRADVFLQGPDVEVACSEWADPDPQRPPATAGSKDLAAAHALATLARRLVDRATHAAVNLSQPDTRA